MTLGRYGSVTVEEARDQARRKLGAVANGQDPAQQAATRQAAPILKEVAPAFLSEHVELKRKPKTLSSYQHAVDHHVLPRLGRRRINEISRIDISRLHELLASTPYMANYVITVLSSLYSWAVDEGSLRRASILHVGSISSGSTAASASSSEEFAQLGEALREAETTGIPYFVDEARPTAKHAAKPENRLVIVAPDAVAAIRLLMLTGCRLREVLELKWQYVDFERRLLLLPDSKSGPKAVVLSEFGRSA